jgi:mannitol-specific phosphotransferase system IIBC component
LALSRCAICDLVSTGIKRVLSPGSIIVLHAFVPKT